MMKPQFDSESDGEDVVTKQRKQNVIMDSESDGEPVAHEEVQNVCDQDLKPLTQKKGAEEDYIPEEETFLLEEDETESVKFRCHVLDFLKSLF